MLLSVVLFLDPLDELTVESIDGAQVQRAGEKLLADTSEKTFDFSFGGAVSHWSVVKKATHTGADLDDFLGRVDGPVVDVERLGDSPFIERGAKSLDESINILSKEELAVATDAAGVIDEGNEANLNRVTFVLDVGTDESVALPQLVGVSF